MKRILVTMVLLLFIVVVPLFPHPGLAQESQDDDPVYHRENDTSDYEMSMGLGGRLHSSPYYDVSGKLLITGWFQYETEHLYIEVGETSKIGFKSHGFKVLGVGHFRDAGYEANDSEVLKGMDDRKVAFESGLGFAYESWFGEWELIALTDISGNHEGQEASLTYGKTFELNRFSIKPSAGLVWQSSKLADYYYGVKKEEATADRKAYELESVLNYEVGLNVDVALTRHWSLMTEARVEFLNSDIQNSPIVEDDRLYSGFCGLAYRFK